MDKIQDKASKLFNDNKAKFKLGKNSQKEQANKASSHATCISYTCCVYCPKVFISSRYLMKHIMRRHSDELVSLHKKCVKHETSKDLQNLISLVQDEFSSLKKELLCRNVTVNDELNKTTSAKEKNSELQENTSKVSKENDTTENNAATDAGSKEVKLMEEKLCEIEKSNQNLYCKFEELNNMLQNEVLLKKDASNHLNLNEERILRAQESQFIELRHILLSELKTLLFNELQESKNEWKSRLLEQKNEIKRLDWSINTVKKQAEYPDKIKEIEKKLEHHIIQFLSTSNHRSAKANSSHRKTESHKHKTHHQTLRNKKSHQKNPEDKTPEPSKCKEHSGISPNQLSFLVAEKMSKFNIAFDATKLSSTEFQEKSQLINAEKEYLAKKYPNFSEIHENLNMYANHKAHSRLKVKKCRKIRFSEPLTSSDITSSSKVCVKGSTCESPPLLLNEEKQLPHLKKQELSDTEYEELAVSKKTIHSVHESNGFVFPDYGGGGDCSQASHNHQELVVSQKKLSSVHESEGFVFPDYIEGSHCTQQFLSTECSPIAQMVSSSAQFKTSSPIKDFHESKELNRTFSKDYNSITSLSNYKMQSCASSELQKNSDYVLNAQPIKNEEMTSVKNFTQLYKAENSSTKLDDDDFSDISPESLSSWDDDEDSSLEGSAKKDVGDI